MSFSFGLLTLIGASRVDRLRSAWFCFATIGSAMWAISIAVFLSLAPDATSAEFWIYGIYVPPMLMLVGLLGYVSWQYKSGKVLTVISCLLMVVLVTLLLTDKTLLYQSYDLTIAGNIVNLTRGWFYPAYMAFFFLQIRCSCSTLGQLCGMRAISYIKNGTLILMIGFGITGVVTLVVDLVLPLLGIYSWIWIGPLFISVTIAMYFYAILKFHMISVASRWLQIATYAVVGLTSVAVYMILFYTIFTTLFKIPNPSTSVLVLNFLMIVIVLLLMPVIREVNAVLRSMVMVGQVDIAYVIKKLNKLATKNIDLRIWRLFGGSFTLCLYWFCGEWKAVWIKGFGGVGR